MYPVQGKTYITQGYGLTEYARSAAGRKAYKAWGGEHKGIDIGTHRINLPTVAVVSGKIVTAGMSGGLGNLVEIKGADGWIAQAAHLQNIAPDLKVGMIIGEGTQIGHVGTTGASDGIHLHVGSWRRTVLGKKEYRNPSIYWMGSEEKAPVMPTKRLIKSTRPEEKGVYAWDGEGKWPIINEDTALWWFLKDWKDEIELIEHDLLVKLPERMPFPMVAQTLKGTISISNK